MGIEFTVVLTLLTAAHNAEGKTADFSLDARVVTAIENGPIVVKATLTYHGDGRIRIVGAPNGRTTSFVTGPARWKYHRAGHTEVGFSPRPRLSEIVNLARHDSITEYLPAHRDFGDARGTANVVVNWDVHRANEEGPGAVLPAKLTREVEVVMAKETPATFRELCGRLCKNLDEATDPRDAAKEAWAHLKGCRRKELLPLALRLLDSAQTKQDSYQVVSFMNALPIPQSERKKAFLEYLMRPHPRSMAEVFNYWSGCNLDPRLVTDQQLLELVDGARSVWVRALAAATLQQDLDQRRRKRIEDEIRATLEPNWSPAFISLLADLDSARFQAREAATKKLSLSDEGVERMISQALTKSQSAEAERRLRQAFKEMQIRDPSPESVRALQKLDVIGGPMAKALVTTVAAGPSQLRSTREAKLLLQQWTEPAFKKK